MEKSMVVGLMLAVLCVITSEFACDGSELDPEAVFNFGYDLGDPEARLYYGSWKRSNRCQWQRIDCDNTNGAVFVIHIPQLCPMNSESSIRYGFWNLIEDISPRLPKYLEYLDSSLAALEELDLMEFLHQVLAIILACSFMISV
ncbi:hypothetical protein HRI_001562000 [Hibiscus trionum]|uniref:Leucine-rich repeat-containing N-terminal plant-type domain-containing protein n=1 Tax=Hibiscus trionum TaxID=183268 RepID=A0A9W7HLA2_HIBTR|nr:hypothetical protein HRI_001562000 [Hibiscus trionum]